MLHLKCLAVLWIHLSQGLLSNLYSDIMLYTTSGTFIILANSVLCFFFMYIKVYSIICSIIKAHSWIWDTIKAYSGLFKDIEQSVWPLHIYNFAILSPGIFWTRGLFKTLWNVDRAYSEPFHRALFSHIQAYSESCAMLAYIETWHTRNPGIFRTLP